MSKSVNKEILDAMEIISKADIDNTPFLILKTGSVISVLGNNKYTVKIDGVDSSASSIVNMTFIIGDSVKIIYSNTNQNDKNIIGKVMK